MVWVTTGSSPLMSSSTLPTAPAPTHRVTPSLEVRPPPGEEQRSTPSSPSQIPSVVLSPTPVRSRAGSNAHNYPPAASPAISLNLDLAGDPSLDPPQHHASTAPTSFQTTITDPTFWRKLHEFLVEQFANREDASAAFEEFLVASKNELSITDIAKIRDRVGVFGMGGT